MEVVSQPKRGRGRPKGSKTRRKKAKRQSRPQPRPIQEQPVSQSPESPLPFLTASDAPSEQSTNSAPLDDKFNAVISEVLVDGAAPATGEVLPAEPEWIDLSPEGVRKLLQDGSKQLSDLLLMPELAMLDIQAQLMSPLVRRWLKALFEHADDPELAAFAIGLSLYSVQVGPALIAKFRKKKQQDDRNSKIVDFSAPEKPIA